MHRITSIGAPILGELHDSNQQVWVLQGQNLISVPRRHGVTPAIIALAPCKHPETLEINRGNPIYLGLKKPELCLFCTLISGQPTLQYKEQNVLNLYNQSEPVKPFLFYHNQNGRMSTFESVAFPGWFIAGCSEGGCPLIITQELGKAHITDFGITVLN
ncbi:interleukin-36 alpha [Erinaceus europaeus]|uniref:Interleukin-1 n=1 Tax=Erinaceus europaeus TaxID=9365 RepID=A0ABM3X6W8_ERIEU|nr:interleukin-36 alpha [Erinaceus europaeus]